MIVAGQWSCVHAGYGEPYIRRDWGCRVPALAQLPLPVLVATTGMLHLPLSHVWLIFHGQHAKAMMALCKFNGRDYEFVPLHKKWQYKRRA